MDFRRRRSISVHTLGLLTLGYFFGACSSKTPPQKLQEPSPVSSNTIAAPKSNLYFYILLQEQLSDASKSKDRIKILENALKIDPASQFLLTKLAHEYLKTNQIDQAEQKSKQALELCTTCREPYSLLGRIYQQKQDFPSAEKYFLKSMELDKEDSGEDVLFLTTIYMNTHQLDKAVGVLKDFIQRNPENEMAYYYLGRVYSETNQIDQAIATYSQIIDKSPDFPHSYKALGLIYEYQGNMEKALGLYSKALSLEPDNFELARHVSMVYLDLKKYPEAKEKLIQITKLQPQDMESKVRLALLYLREDNYTQAKSIFENVLKSQPDLDQVKYYLGIIHERDGNLGQALHYLKDIRPESNTYADSQQSVAFILDSQNKTNEAKQILIRALEKKPNDVSLLVLLAKIHSKQKNPAQGLAILEKAAQNNPKEEQLWFTMGEIYDQSNNFQKSVESFKHVIELNPNHASALNYLGFSYAEKGVNLKEAEQLVQRALKIRPKDGYITDSLGWVYFKMGLFQEAVKQLKEALHLVPNEPTILEHLGDAFAKLGQHEDAKKAYKQAFENSKEHVEKKRIETKLQIFRSR